MVLCTGPNPDCLCFSVHVLHCVKVLKFWQGSKEGDTDSIVYGGSIASTVPDRYGFIGGTQYSFDRE